MAFTTRELVFIALSAALLFVLNFSLGAGVIAATGIPGSSALVDGITNLLVITFAALVIRKFGVMGTLYFIYGIIALPTHMAGGPPGFIPKIFLLAGSAYVYDLIVYWSRFRKWGFIVGLPILLLGGFSLYVGTYSLLGMPEAEKLLKAMPILIGAFLPMGYIGMWLGFVSYKRLKDKHVVRQISSRRD